MLFAFAHAQIIKVTHFCGSIPPFSKPEKKNGVLFMSYPYDLLWYFSSAFKIPMVRLVHPDNIPILKSADKKP